jgi:hypothetical protein
MNRQPVILTAPAAPWDCGACHSPLLRTPEGREAVPVTTQTGRALLVCRPCSGALDRAGALVA